MNRLFAALALMATTMPPVLGAERCNVTQVQVCTPAGCRAAPLSGIYLVLDHDRGLYGRCDEKSPCDWYPATFQAAGMWLNIDFLSGPQGAKVSLADGSMVEVVSIGDTVIVNRGMCARS